MKSKSKDTVMALANAIELGACVVHEIAGHEVGKTINGSKATVDAIGRLMAARLSARFSKHTSQLIK